MKRFLALLCMAACTFSLMGCNDGTASGNSDRDHNQNEDMVNDSQGGSDGNDILSGIFEDECSDGMILTINGNDYDLSGHYNETISQMVKDGVIVALSFGDIFDDTGYKTIQTELTEEDKSNLLSTVYHFDMDSEHATFYYHINSAQNRLGFLSDFETMNGIDNDFTEEDIQSLEDFVPTLVYNNGNKFTGWLEGNEYGEYNYTAIYRNGEPVDLTAYEEKADELTTALLAGDISPLENFWQKESLTANPPRTTNIALATPVALSSRLSEDPRYYDQIKNTYMILLAERDIYWEIQDGTTDYFCIINYTTPKYEDGYITYELYGIDHTKFNPFTGEIME